MIKMYGIPSCNTVKKASDWLKANNIHFEFHDYKKKGVTKEKLKEWSNHFGYENIINKKGTTWNKLSDEEKDAITNEKTTIDYLAENTSAIKRPIVEVNGKYLIRFNEEEYKEALL